MSSLWGEWVYCNSGSKLQYLKSHRRNVVNFEGSVVLLMWN